MNSIRDSDLEVGEQASDLGQWSKRAVSKSSGRLKSKLRNLDFTSIHVLMGKKESK